MEHPKPVAPKNRSFLDWIARQVCVVCGVEGVPHDNGEKLNTPSHLKGKQTNGDAGNVVTKCMRCHVEFGQLGMVRFQQKHPNLHLWNEARRQHREFVMETRKT